MRLLFTSGTPEPVGSSLCLPFQRVWGAFLFEYMQIKFPSNQYWLYRLDGMSACQTCPKEIKRIVHLVLASQFTTHQKRSHIQSAPRHSHYAILSAFNQTPFSQTLRFSLQTPATNTCNQSMPFWLRISCATLRVPGPCERDQVDLWTSTGGKHVI